MSNEENQSEIASTIPRLFEVTYGGAIVFAAIAAMIFLAALPALVIALIVLGAAALLLLIGAAAFKTYTCAIMAQYVRAPGAAAATYGFPTYAALKASWSLPVRLVAC